MKHTLCLLPPPAAATRRGQYGAERMQLVVLGGEPLERLEAWVAELFAPVPRGVSGPAASFAAAGKPFEVRWRQGARVGALWRALPAASICGVSVGQLAAAWCVMVVAVACDAAVWLFCRTPVQHSTRRPVCRCNHCCPLPPPNSNARAALAASRQPRQGRSLYLAPAVKEHHEVTVTFQLPCLRGQYTNKPDSYISHLVGHEGPGSLLSALKVCGEPVMRTLLCWCAVHRRRAGAPCFCCSARAAAAHAGARADARVPAAACTSRASARPQARGWAIELCAGVDDDGYNANTAVYLFTVSIVLTEAGLAAGPGLGLAPVGLLFQYLRLLEQTGERARAHAVCCASAVCDRAHSACIVLVQAPDVLHIA